MGSQTRQQDRNTARHPEAPGPVRRLVARDPFAPASMSNAGKVRALTASPYTFAVPAAAGNGMRIVYMPPETIVGRVPDGADADDAVLAQRAADAQAAAVAQDDAANQWQTASPATATDGQDGPSTPTQPQRGVAVAAPASNADAARATAAAKATDDTAAANDAAKDTTAEEAADRTAAQDDAPQEAVDEAVVDEAAVDEEAGEAAAAPADAVTRSRRADDSAGPDPRVIVQRWQGGVANASAALPHRNMAAVAGEPARIASAAGKATAARRAQAVGVPAEAVANITPPPAVPDPPAPPRSDPIPTYTAAIDAASHALLPDAPLPELVRSKEHEVVPGMKLGGNFPHLGDHAVSSKLFNLLETEGAEAAAKIPEDAANPERAALESARAALAKPLQEDKKEADGVAAPLTDKGPQPIAPLPAGLGTPVGQVVARLLASLGPASADVVARLRRMAYPQGVLAREFPDIGQAFTRKVAPRMLGELHDIATAAGVSSAGLDAMVATRKDELDRQLATTQQALVATDTQAQEDVGKAGQEALDAIEGARQLTDEEIIQRQEAATGGSDPEVINARRDLVIRWVRSRVTTATSTYQKAGDRRVRDLTEAQLERVDAYNALAQREEYQGLHPAPPLPAHDRTQPEVARQLADFTAAVRADARATVDDLKNAMRPLFSTARDMTQEHRTTVENAGNDAIDAARTWAEDRILEGQSWWDRFKATLGRWFGDAQKANEQWSVQRTEETRNGIASDLDSVAAIGLAVQKGLTKETLLQTRGLTDDQRAVIMEFFALPPGTHPLDIAAAALRQRLANQYLEAARPAFEAELLARPDGDMAKVAEVAHIARPTFNGPKIAQDIHAQLDNFDSDEGAMLHSLEALSAFEGAVVRRLYRVMFHVDMDWAMRAAFDSDEMDQAQLRLAGKGADADAAALDYAFGVINTDEKAIMALLRGRSQEEIAHIRAAYRRRYGKDMDQALLDNLDEGNEQDQAMALASGDKEKADAIAIDEAMRGGLFGWGTSRDDIEATYQRVHDEVLAEAQHEGWSASQMQAEVRRRLALIERKFNEQYKDVEQYNEPGLHGKSVLRRAFSSEMDPGPERDLANAFADDDMVKADAARIEIERQGVWASDETINKVLAGQYEHALAEARLDQAPARQAMLDRKRAELMHKTPAPTEDEISIEMMRLERQLDQDADTEAQRRSHISMALLDATYKENYFHSLSGVIEENVSGVDQEKARVLHAQGGRLTALQDIDLATKGTGTDEEALKRRIGSMTKSEIDALAVQWAYTHNGEDLRRVLDSELSGRDASDILDMYDHGAPESAKARIDQEQRRVNRELGDLTGVLGGAAAGNEADWVTQQMGRLAELKADLDRRDLSDDERALLRDQLDYRIDIVQQGVEDHRRAIDSMANLAAQVASLAVALTVGAALTALSGGALGPVMIAVIASVAATVTTMGTKVLIQGGAYGTEDIALDLAVGVVDAITAAATAGMGGKILKGAAGATEQAAGRIVQPNRLTRMLGNVGRTEAMQSVARSRAGQLAGKVLTNLNEMESGFLTRGIKGSNLLARMAQGDSKALRILAEGVAQGLENAVTALPTSFTATALNDKTQEGNPLLNLATGTWQGVKGAVQMGAVIHGVQGVGGAAYAHYKLSTPEGRLAEANRILGAAREQHRTRNRDAGYAEFLRSPEGMRAQAEIDARGLVGEQRAAARPETPPVLEPPQKGPHAAPQEQGGLGTPHAEAVDPATRALRDGLPATVTERLDVRVNDKLDGNTVQVIPDPRGPGFGVRVEAGPHATPTDVLLHANTIQTMRRYQGLLGKLRQAHDWFNLTTVGTLGWEARLELEKLPGIVHERMQQLQGSTLTPERHAQLLNEITHLGNQIDMHQRVLDNLTLRDQPGRGYVAAEGMAAQADAGAARDTAAALPDIDQKRAALPPGERSVVDAHLVALDKALHAGDRTAFHAARDAIATALAINPDQVAEAVYLPRELRARPLTPLEQRAREAERLKEAKRVQKDMGQIVGYLLKRSRKEPAMLALAEHIARQLNRPVSDLIFDQMVDWIISKGKLVNERLGQLPASERLLAQAELDALRRQHAAEGSTDAFKKESEKLARKLNLKRDVLEQDILPGYSGRRPGAKMQVDVMRAMAKEQGVDLDGFLMQFAVEQNASAISKMREHLRVVNPDAIIAVERGGVFLADVLAHGDPALRKRINAVPKGDDKSRAPFMEQAIRAHLAGGKKTSFVIVDFYMGGGASGEFMKMAERILANYPQAKFELVWLREEHGFERHGPNRTGIVLPPLRETPAAMQEHFTQTPLNVRLVLGDDMKVVFNESATDVITIIDRHGRVAQKIRVGTLDPETGERLDARGIVIRLMNGVKFPNSRR